MLPKLITAALIIVGLINFLPVAGLLSATRMENAYGIAIAEPDLELLMKHRALLFGLLGGFILYAAFNPVFQPAAFLLAFLSMAGFILLAWQVGDANPQLRRIALVDMAGLVVLAAAVVMFAVQPTATP